MGNSSDPEHPIPSWDPLFDAARERVSEAHRAVAGSAWEEPGRLGKWAWKAHLWASTQRVSATFWGFSLATLVAAIITAIVGWPILGADNDYPEVVLAAASAVAFGSIVFSAVTAASASGGDIAPGYTQVLLNRAPLWLTGLALISGSALLFVLASLRPSRAGAIGAAFLAASMVGFSWLSARRAVADADPLDIARHASAHYRRITRRARNHARLKMRQGLPRGARKDPEAVSAVSRDYELRIVIGFVRQLRAGILSTATHDRVAEAVMLFDGLTSVFTDYAKDTDGQVGRHDGLPSLVTGTAEAVLDAAVRRGDSPAGQYSTSSLVAAAGLPCRDPQFAAVRTLVRSTLFSSIDRHWHDNHTTVAPDCVDAAGRLAAQWLRIGALEDGRHVFDSLSRVAQEAIGARRGHIAIPAVSQLVGLLVVATRLAPEARLSVLEHWGNAMLPVAILAPVDRSSSLGPATDIVLGPVNLAHGKSATLQQALWSIPADADASACVTDKLLSILERVLPVYGEAEQSWNVTAAKGLSLLYALTLFVTDRLQGEAAEVVATRIMSLVTGWVGEGNIAEVLKDPDVIAPIWSTILAAGYTANDPSMLCRKAEDILRATDVPNSWSHPRVHAGYIVSFYRGLLSASGYEDERLAGFQETVERHAESEGLFARAEIADYGMGRNAARVPAMATVGVVAPTNVTERVAAWVLEQWPRFAAPPDEGRTTPGGEPGS